MSESLNTQHNETDALNRVNEAQKHFDSLVAQVKKSAPRGSDWRSLPGVQVS